MAVTNLRDREGARTALDLPPVYRAVRLRESGDAFAHARAIAAEAGAGTLVHVGRFDLVEFAVVLEPEEPLLGARRALFAGLAALADAIGTHCPPEKKVAFRWPDALLIDGLLVGGARLAWPEGCAEEVAPDWLVLGVQLVAARLGGADANFLAGSTSLEEEGFADGTVLVESFARHLMVHFDAWAERGFKPVAEAYLGRLPKAKAAERRAIDANGDLLIHGHSGAAVERVPLTGLDMPTWYDPKRRGPRP